MVQRERMRSSFENGRQVTSARNGMEKYAAPCCLYGQTSYGGHPVTQQTLPSFFLYSSVCVVLVALLGITVLFLVIGALLITSERHYEVRGTYSHVHRYQYPVSKSGSGSERKLRGFTVGNVTHWQGVRTRVLIHVQRQLKAPVYLYYTLTNFYQNHRSFYEGRANDMLAGTERASMSFPECMPLERPGYVDGTGSTPVTVNVDNRTVKMQYGDFYYHPCGVAPWSMFNDTFVLYSVKKGTTLNTDDLFSVSQDSIELICNTSDFSAVGEPLNHSTSENKCSKSGITRRADKEVRHKELRTGLNLWSLRYPFANNDVYLSNGWYANEPGHRLTDPLDYDVQVWIRTAFLPSFSKLFRIINMDLLEGSYILEVEEFFDVTSLKGEKGYLLRTSALLGRWSVNMGIAFLVVGALSFVLLTVLTINHYFLSNGCATRFTGQTAAWYVFDSAGVEIQNYYKLRAKRYDMSTGNADYESDCE
uniref:LEM3 (Ligand-effect modulator 3) family / CDC50 family n=1 Tax=Trypanosoma vivax (strain Y486) TaxID=1055687 RepID=G0U8J7_TRYVY|nr:conserved hypothetical protein [Trypanosoma vivax Y486]